MRDAQALQRQFVVEREVGAEIVLQQFAVDVLEALDRQRLAGFGHLVRDLLELGEHRLPDDRAADGVDLVIDQVGPLGLSSAALSSKCLLSSCSLNVLATSATKIV